MARENDAGFENAAGDMGIEKIEHFGCMITKFKGVHVFSRWTWAE